MPPKPISIRFIDDNVFAVSVHESYAGSDHNSLANWFHDVFGNHVVEDDMTCRLRSFADYEIRIYDNKQLKEYCDRFTDRKVVAITTQDTEITRLVYRPAQLLNFVDELDFVNGYIVFKIQLSPKPDMSAYCLIQTSRQAVMKPRVKHAKKKLLEL